MECDLEDAAELVEAIVALSLKGIWVERFGGDQEADEEVESEQEKRGGRRGSRSHEDHEVGGRR